LLTAGRRMAVPRQQTLRAAIEWSYALLSEAEQAMLRRLGVFAGSFTLEAVAAVATGAPVEASDAFDVPAGLVDKSLVVSLAGENRYRLLESTRAFTLEKLAAGHYAELARRLCEHMTIVFERADRAWPTTPGADWLAVYEPELDNLRVALGWSLRLDGNPALGVNLVSYTDWLWRELSLVQEQRRWFELALTFVDDATPPSVEARIRLGLGWYFYPDRGRLSHNLRAIELMRQVGGEAVLLGQAEVAPVSWTPEYLGWRSPQWARQEEPTHVSSVAGWLSWWTLAARLRSWRRSLNRRRSRSGIGWRSGNATPVAATAA
jgi:hypothetical protein